MDDKKYFEDLDPKTFSEQDWQDIFDLLERNPEKFRAMFRDEKVAAESEKIANEFMARSKRDIEISEAMQDLENMDAPDHVKEFWYGMMHSLDAEAESKTWVLDAERNKDIEEFWNFLQYEFGEVEGSEVEEGDADDPLSEQYFVAECEPPVFKRNRDYGTNHELITVIFSDDAIPYNPMDLREYKGALPDLATIRNNGTFRLEFRFFDAYTELKAESEQE